MDNLSAPIAAKVVASIPIGQFNHLLDVGGASGSWTIAFLRANPRARATIFDLPQVIPQAKARIAAAGLADRVVLAPGDFYVDPLPKGADLAWVSAIVHQNARSENRDLFAKVFAALVPAGRILIRDMVMEESRTAPVAGAMFAINMLTGPHKGGTFTLNELRDDLQSAGFRDVALVRKDEGMHSIVAAAKPS
jgi:precorrin-6B methylase 2